LPAPLALGIGILAVQRDPLHAWGTGYAAAGAVGGVSFLLTLWLLWQTRAARALRFVAGLLTLLLLMLPLLQAATADLQQAEIYEGLGAYTLALRLDAAAGPNEQGMRAQVRVRTKWAQAASARQDYATATTQWRAALALDPQDVQVGGKHAALVATTYLWSEALTVAREYDAALRVTANEAHSPSCDAACQPQMRDIAADTYLQWANMLLLAGNTGKALETLQLIIQNYPTTPSAGIARQALGEVQALDALNTAVAAGAGGDHAAMNTQLEAIASKYPATMAAAEAAEVPEPVDGRIVDYSGASVNGDRLFLLAFSSEAQARGFQYNFAEDTSAFKVATTLGAGGSFTALLPPGYWYVAIWEDATQASYGYLNETIDWQHGNDAFTVRPFTPSSAGTIVGF
jgi:tetratricopeptide (TPR) repeat protein